MPPSKLTFLADSNVTAQAVRDMRAAGYEVVYAAERKSDPGDEALLNEAAEGGQVLVTKDHDIGVLVFRDGRAHSGVLLIDDMGNPASESKLILETIRMDAENLLAKKFVRRP